MIDHLQRSIRGGSSRSLRDGPRPYRSCYLEVLSAPLYPELKETLQLASHPDVEGSKTVDNRLSDGTEKNRKTKVILYNKNLVKNGHDRTGKNQ